ncbi:HutD/Ves family protein [Gemmobacter denitrificans]|uniref:HutD family protein n=1 Tax=Gemmobacter denitrificans TaxID=3123040 RepID=A0ABU8C169_9RHOB
MRIIRFADCPPAPWKNGAGSTRELWRLEDADGMLARISVAEITGNQPFSSFPGIDRIILQLDGPAMVLSLAGKDHHIATPFAFPGEAQVSCHLSGSGVAHDLNLMVRRDRFVPRMELETSVAGEALDPGATAFLMLASAQLVLPGIPVERGDLILPGAKAPILDRQVPLVRMELRHK